MPSMKNMDEDIIFLKEVITIDDDNTDEVVFLKEEIVISDDDDFDGELLRFLYSF